MKASSHKQVDKILLRSYNYIDINVKIRNSMIGWLT